MVNDGSKIWEVTLDVNTYQVLRLEEETAANQKLMRFDCLPKREEWVPPAVYSPMPRAPAADFWSIGGVGAFAATSSATAKVEDYLRYAGELLPLPYKGQVFTVLNVTECMDCLDHEKTRWAIGKQSGKRLHILEYAFRLDRLSESSIFKIPETSLTRVLCYEGLKDPEDEFKPTVERLGLTGIKFRELWPRTEPEQLF